MGEGQTLGGGAAVLVLVSLDPMGTMADRACKQVLFRNTSPNIPEPAYASPLENFQGGMSLPFHTFNPLF